MAKKEFNIVSGIKPLAVGQWVVLHPEQQNWYKRAYDGIALFYTGYSDDLLS
jgi:hypothetical protein